MKHEYNVWIELKTGKVIAFYDCYTNLTEETVYITHAKTEECISEIEWEIIASIEETIITKK